MSGELNYRFGASVAIIDKDNWIIIVFERGEKFCKIVKNSEFNQCTNYIEKVKDFCKVEVTKFNRHADYICLPQNQHIAQQIENLVAQILSITCSDDYLQDRIKQEKVKELEHKIDSLVYKLYELTGKEIILIEEGK